MSAKRDGRIRSRAKGPGKGRFRGKEVRGRKLVECATGSSIQTRNSTAANVRDRGNGSPASLGAHDPIAELVGILAFSLSDFHLALIDLMAFYDRVAGNAGGGHGWTSDEVCRLAEIRALAYRRSPLFAQRLAVPGIPSPLVGQTVPAGYGKPSGPKKTPRNGS